jgi:Ca2+-transporting ATPase
MEIDHQQLSGLNREEVIASRNKYGDNKLEFTRVNPVLEILYSLAKEPMVLLLLIASVIYFISGDVGDGIFLAVAIVLVASISLYQDSRSRQALNKLKSYTQAQSKVIRGGEVQSINSDDIVLGDLMLVEEGMIIPADGNIVHSNDFLVNESILTGESFSVSKNATSDKPIIYKGTTVASGMAIAEVNAIAQKTALGKIGKSLEEIQIEKTPLEVQIEDFVRKMVIAGAVIFFLVWGINYFRSLDVLESLLNALTLAMSVLPEEIPVAFTTFMAIGAWRMMKRGIIIKQMKTVEALGLATTVCVDKTGTITENKMELARIYDFKKRIVGRPEGLLTPTAGDVLTTAMWASEPLPFDPMEVALHDAYGRLMSEDERPANKMIHEYPLSGKPPMMTHVFSDAEGRRIIAAKGGPEALLAVSNLSEEERESVRSVMNELAGEGFRLLGVGEAIFDGEDYPERQQDFNFDFKGLVAFYDPPKANIESVFSQFEKSGITVKIITGDNARTTTAIAKQINFKGTDQQMSGEELMKLDDDALRNRVGETQIYTRMFPDAKLRIIEALKAKGEIVAMTGDGVNDGPALKSAHIGIAMGKRGTEIAKRASSLILVEDDLSKMLDAIAMGRKIYTNLKKAIRYIISIHIPIILTVFIPLALGWIYPNIFSPVHVILLELIMGPTCSIIYENEPIEPGTMLRPPRPVERSFFSRNELLISIIQGLGITIGAMVIYQYAVGQGYSEGITRAMVFTVLISANIFLTLVNRSFEHSVWRTLGYRNSLVPLIIGLTLLMLLLMLFIPSITAFFELEQLNVLQIALAFGAGFLSVIWFEIVKLSKSTASSKLLELVRRT